MRKLQLTFLDNPDHQAEVSVQTYDDKDGVRYFIVKELGDAGVMSSGLALSEANVKHLMRILEEIR